MEAVPAFWSKIMPRKNPGRSPRRRAPDIQPLAARGTRLVKSTINELSGRFHSFQLGRVSQDAFLDQLGQRAATEEIAVLIYDELLRRPELDPALVPKLRHIRDAENRHFNIVKDAIRELGADPEEKGPGYQTAEAEMRGLLEQIQYRDTTLPYALRTILNAELGDNAGWELLCIVARSAGHPEMASRFEKCLLEEQEHLSTIRNALMKSVKFYKRYRHAPEMRVH